MELFDVLHKNSIAYPDKTVFEDELYGTYDFFGIEKASSRIYSYLSQQKVKAEDIVIIRMKRSARIFLTMLGVWKAGAAFVVIGENSPEKYVNQVLQDAPNGLIFTDDTFEKAMEYSEKEGFSRVYEHNLACIIYSTGSSGIFKGSMHEYGAVKRVLKQFKAANVKPLYEVKCEQTRNVIYYPFYTIDSVMELIWAVFLGNYYYIIPYYAVLDFSKYVKILNDKKIEILCVSPNNYRKIKQNSLPYLKRIDLSLDVNIDELNEDCNYTNTYALTEAFSWVTSGYIEKKEYDVVPSGKPCPLTEVKICDKHEKELPIGEIGEIYVYNEFFRGYLKRPDLTEKTLFDGWIHTGDMGYTDLNGNYYVLGRKIDMLETENGYIIPVFIRVQIKKLFPDIKKSYVKLFKKENEIKICLFYCASREYSLDEFVSVLTGKLPEYMMPTHCVKKDDFDYFAFGKIDRLSFEELN